MENNIQKIKKYILENYRNPKLSLSSMSEYMALNASYLSTAFSRREGITVSNYILNLRLQKAEELILKWHRYMDAPKPVYQNLYELVKGKDYFVLTTNVDHCFQKAGFAKNRIFYTQGDYGLF